MWKPKTENWKSNSNGGTTNQNQNQNQSVQRCFPHEELWVGNIFDTYHLMVLRFYDTYRSTVRYIIGEVDNISRRHRRHWVIYELSSGNKLGQFRADSLGNLPLPFPLHTFAALLLRIKSAERPTSAKRGILETFCSIRLQNCPLYPLFPSHSLSLPLCAL